MKPRLPTGAYDYLRNEILSGRLAAHYRLKEQEIATQLDISRTPVREALARLELEGLVRRTHRRGAVVSPVELDEVDEIYEIRAALETLVARRACERATEAEIEAMDQALRRAQDCLDAGDIDSILKHTVHFHELLNRSSKSPRLAALLRSLEDRLVPFRHTGIKWPGRAPTIMRQHWAILEALRRRDSVEMQRWVEEHAQGGRQAAVQTYLEAARSRRMEQDGAVGKGVHQP